VTLVGKPRLQGHLAERHVGPGKKFTRRLDAKAASVLSWRASVALPEYPREIHRMDAGFRGEVAHAKCAAKFGTNP